MAGRRQQHAISKLWFLSSVTIDLPFDLATCDLSARGLLFIPEEVLSRSKFVGVLRLSKNPLQKLDDTLRLFSKLRILEISFCGLTELPEQLKSLELLEKLDLSYNCIGIFPDAVLSLGELRGLNMAGCQISEVPKTLEKLNKLIDLNLADNILETFPDAITSLKDLKALNLAQNGISELPAPIGGLGQLSGLNLSHNQLKELPDSIGRLKLLQVLDISENRLSLLPDVIGDLRSLVVLNLQDNFIQQLPRSISNLIKLEHFSVGFNFLGTAQMAEIPDPLLEAIFRVRIDCVAVLHAGGEDRQVYTREETVAFRSLITKLIKVKYLDVSACGLLDLPPEMSNLQQLAHLIVNGNALQKFPDIITDLRSLGCLEMQNCDLFEVPPAIAELSLLSVLNLSRNRIKELPDNIGSLTKLSQLDLSENRLTSLPKTFGNLTSLENLDISGNEEIREFPAVIPKLRNLKILDISCCSISELPKQVDQLHALATLLARNNNLKHFPDCTLEMKSLTYLDLSNVVRERSANEITELPEQLQEKPASLRFLNVSGNALIKPPQEICIQGLPAIRQYLRDMHHGGRIFCDDCISVLGDTGAGKSSVVLTLKEKRPCATKKEDRTHVLQQDVVKIGGCSVNINDFGGHAIYEAVLPIFLPRKGIGILAYDMSEEWDVQTKKVWRWLTTVISRSPGMHLIIVGTHADLLPEETIVERKREMSKFVKDVFDAAKADLEELISNKRGHPPSANSVGANASVSAPTPQKPSLASTGTDTKSGVPKNTYEECLEQNLRYLESATQIVLSFSCAEEAAGDGIEKLSKEISRKLNRGEQMPHSWIKFMESLLCYKGTGASACLTMEAAMTLFGSFSKQPEALQTILLYLVATSQIIWLQDHKKLSNFIFHRIDAVLDICKAVLHHDSPTVHDSLAQDLQKYKTGLITERLLKYLLKEYKQDFDTAKELMQNFNVICLGYEAAGHCMILPCRLPDCEPGASELCSSETNAGAHALPIVHVKIRFFTSLIPHALFETSLASLLNHIRVSGKAEPAYWKNGLSYEMDSLKLRYERIENGVEVRALSLSRDNFRKLWKELHYLLGLIATHLLSAWPGAMLTVCFICPTVVYASPDQTADCHFRETTVEELLREEEPPVSEYHCPSCKRRIPRAFMYNCKPEHLGQDQLKLVEEFLESIDSKISPTGSELEASSMAMLKRNCKKERIHLLQNLTKQDVMHVLDTLISKEYITDEDQETIESKVSANDMARSLLDCIAKKNDRATLIFVEALESTYVKRPDLAKLIRGQTDECQRTNDK